MKDVPRAEGGHVDGDSERCPDVWEALASELGVPWLLPQPFMSQSCSCLICQLGRPSSIPQNRGWPGVTVPGLLKGQLPDETGYGAKSSAGRIGKGREPSSCLASSAEPTVAPLSLTASPGLPAPRRSWSCLPPHPQAQRRLAQSLLRPSKVLAHDRAPSSLITSGCSHF